VKQLENSKMMMSCQSQLKVNFIPMGVYHRVIKGTGNLKIKLIKNRQ
jgi:hypothetical protein